MEAEARTLSITSFSRKMKQLMAELGNIHWDHLLLQQLGAITSSRSFVFDESCMNLKEYEEFMDHEQLQEANAEKVCQMRVSYYHHKKDSETRRQYAGIKMALLQEEN